MTITFKYKIVKRPDNTEARTPSIPVTLKGKDSIDIIALLDSGADVSAIPKGIAEIIGLDLTGKKSYADGIGGKVESIDSKVYITVKKGHETYTILVPVKVILNDHIPVILGREVFFNKFIISFDQSELKVMLKLKNK